MTTPQNAPIQTPATEGPSQDLATLSVSPTPKAEPDILYTHKQLNNGIGIHLSRFVHGPEEVCFTISIAAGSGKQNEHQEGVAHFLEHMMLELTSPLAKRIAELMQTEEGANISYGGVTRGATTEYFATFPATYTEELLALFGAQLITPVFSEQALVRERQVILAELAGTLNPYGIGLSSAIQALYPNEKGFPLIGSKESLETITREELLAFHRQHYVGGNINLFVSGRFPDNTEDLVAEHFSEVVASSPVALPRRVPSIWDDPQAQRYLVTHSTQTYVNVTLMFPAPLRSEPDYFVLPVILDLLQCAPTSPMNNRLRLESGLCYSADASKYSTVAGSERMVINFGLPNREYLVPAFDAVRKVIDDMTQSEFPHGVLKASVARVKNSGESSTWFRTHHSNIVSDRMRGGDITLPAERRAALDKITPEDVKRVSRSIFRDAFTHLYGDVDPTVDYTFFKK